MEMKCSTDSCSNKALYMCRCKKPCDYVCKIHSNRHDNHPMLKLKPPKTRRQIYEILYNSLSASKTPDIVSVLFQHRLEQQQVIAYLLSVSEAYFNLGKLEDSIRVSEQALELAQPCSLERASALFTLGKVYSSLWRYQKSLDFYQESLQLKNELLDPQDISIADSYIELCFLFSQAGNLDSARMYAEKAEGMLETFDDSSIKIRTYLALGFIEFRHCNQQESIQYLEIAQSFPNLNSILSSKIKLCLGLALSFSTTSEALELCNKALEEVRKQINESHPLISEYLYFLSEVYARTKSHTVALKCLGRAIMNLKDVKNSLLVLYIQEKIAEIYMATDENESAVHYFGKALEGWKKVENADKEKISSIQSKINNLRLISQKPKLLSQLQGLIPTSGYQLLLAQASEFQNNYKFKEAFELLQQAIHLIKSECPIDLQTLLNALKHIGGVCISMNQAELGLQYYSEFHELVTKLAPVDELLRASYHSLGWCHYKLRNYREALQYSVDSAKLCRKIYGDSSLELENIYTNVADIYQALNKYNEALTFLEEILRIQRLNFKEDNPRVIDTKQDIENLKFILQS